MNYNRTFNFSAGPAMMPECVLEEIRDEMMNYRGSGMCVMEMSHRSPVFQTIIDEAEQDLRDLMNIPDNYKVLFIQGGATLQFSMIPMNLMKNGKAVYIETGAWSKKAAAEAQKVGEVITLGDAALTCLGHHMVQTALERLCHHDAAEATAIGVVIHLHLLVFGKVANLMGLNVQNTLLGCATDDAFPQHSTHAVGKEGENIHSHGLTSPRSDAPR